MFEDSLLESTHRLSTGSRWPAVASLALQAALAAVIVTVPLLHPERLALALPAMTLAPPLAPPPPPPPPVRVQEVAANATMQQAAPSAPAVQQAQFNLHPVGIEPEGPPVDVMGPMMSGRSSPLVIGEGVGLGTRPSVAVATPVPAGRVNVSRGVAAAMLLAPIRPEYPQIARAAHIEGTVIVHAFISKTGAIESATTVSGPMMLYGAALDAVRAARYRPFLLSGEPVEVETTITINFRLGG